MRQIATRYSPEQRAELIWVRDHHPKAYLRVKAAALLKVDDGQSIGEVATHGILKPLDYKTVRQWVERYAREGLDGLLVRSGRGRKPAFSPCAS